MLDMLGSRIFGAIYSVDARSLKVHSDILKHLRYINKLAEVSYSSELGERVKKAF